MYLYYFLKISAYLNVYLECRVGARMSAKGSGSESGCWGWACGYGLEFLIFQAVIIKYNRDTQLLITGDRVTRK